MYVSSFWSIALSFFILYTTVSAVPIPRPDASAAQSTHDAVLPVDFPDPSFIKGPDGYYAFATSGSGKKIQVAKSPSFQDPSWSIQPIDALPDPGAWTDRTNNIWAPYVSQTTSGQFVMYYAAPPLQDTTKHCIGTATSKNIMGPYTPSTTPFACDLSIGGSIDPSVFKDPKSGNVYVMYKVDGNSLGGNAPTPIKLQQIDPSDGITPIGPAITIFDQDSTSASDGSLVEAPTMMFANGMYFLLFSTNDYTTSAYDVRYVTSSTLQGPFQKQQTTLLRTGDGNGIVGPGSCDVHEGMIAFHGRVSSMPNLQRHMYAGYLQASGGKLTVTGML